jgi:ABC-type dipeptide/oligopeptide/nickel transport system ATPase subunit
MITLDGNPLTTAGRGPHPVQVVYQNPYASLNPMLPIGESIEEGLRSLKVPGPLRREKALELLGRVGLAQAYYDRLPAQLSGGERQRVVIARCLAVEPKVLVADEPTASLDAASQRLVLNLLLEQAHTYGLGILLISHDLKLIRHTCDRSLRLEHGELIAEI